MTFRTDAGGFAFRPKEAKISGPATTWGTKLSQLARMPGQVRIMTYSLPRPDYAKQQLGRRSSGVQLIAHSKFEEAARQIKLALPYLEIRVGADVHSKVVLIEPWTIWVTSANFGSSKWHETAIGMKSEEAHNWYVEHMWTPLWLGCREVR